MNKQAYTAGYLKGLEIQRASVDGGKLHSSVFDGNKEYKKDKKALRVYQKDSDYTARVQKLIAKAKKDSKPPSANMDIRDKKSLPRLLLKLLK